MGKTFDSITAELQAFIYEQPLFFVATAPLAATGHVNLSPKGLDSFRVVTPTRVAYLDLTGSGNETAAHVTENTRLTLMFCAFAGRPQILRLYCSGRVALPGSAEWQELEQLFPRYAGARQVIIGEVDFAQTSCGYGVPVMQFEAQRDTLPRWAESKGPDDLKEYRRTRNSTSIDGLIAPLADEP
jgi:hypothetical protein